MDVRCSTCGEPWDVDYLRFEAIHETDLDPAEADAWCELSDRRLKFNDRYRAKLLAAGWEFAGSVINVLRCPCCPRDAHADPERAEIKASLVDLFGDDEDGLAAAFEDHQL
jgi:hypothetical protein